LATRSTVPLYITGCSAWGHRAIADFVTYICTWRFSNDSEGDIDVEYTFLWIATTALSIVAIYFVWGRKLGSKQSQPAPSHEVRR